MNSGDEIDDPRKSLLVHRTLEQAATTYIRQCLAVGTGIYRDLAQGADATHSAILSNMRADGVDVWSYLDERRAAFRDVAATEEEQKNAFLALPYDPEPPKSGKTMCALRAQRKGSFSRSNKRAPLRRRLCVGIWLELTVSSRLCRLSTLHKGWSRPLVSRTPVETLPPPPLRPVHTAPLDVNVRFAKC